MLDLTHFKIVTKSFSLFNHYHFSIGLAQPAAILIGGVAGTDRNKMREKGYEQPWAGGFD